MKPMNRYRVTVEHLASRNESPTQFSEPSLCFEAASHDEIFTLTQRIRQRGDFDEAGAAALVVGLKLLGEVVLRNRERPMFGEFLPHFGQFIRHLKESTGARPPSGLRGGSSTNSGNRTVE
ncbi:MAG: DUF3861 domain-containing protein [Candidatus Accumulibacter sp.]|jgi:hypothetical protein|nr:DUF3861 domain-containing protein [Accumulibacter sp.]